MTKTSTKPKAPAVKAPKSALPKVIVDTVPTSKRIAETLSLLVSQVEALDREVAAGLRRGPQTAARVFVAVHRLHERQEAAVKALNVVFNNLKVNRIPAIFEDVGVPNIPLAEGFRVSANSVMYASIKPGKKDEAFEWLRSNGLEDLVQESVNAGTLSAAARHMVKEDNQDLPDDLFNCEYIGTTSCTEVKTKGT